MVEWWYHLALYFVIKVHSILLFALNISKGWVEGEGETPPNLRILKPETSILVRRETEGEVIEGAIKSLILQGTHTHTQKWVGGCVWGVCVGDFF